MNYCIKLFFFLLITTVAAQTTIEQKLDKILSTYNVENQPGLSVRVVKNNSVLYSKSFGISNLDYGIKNSDSTTYSIASISKQFTAAAIWTLIEQGKLSLEDDIRKFFPQFPDYGNIIRVKHLLNHTSGIRGYHSLMYLSGFDYNSVYYDNKTVFNLACNQQNLNNKPGEKVLYSNTGYNILALLVEKISKTNLDVFLKTHILKPLEMTQTFVRVSHGVTIKNKAIGYKKTKDGFIYNVTNQLSYGAGSMGSNVIDMTNWINMLNGNVFKFKALAQFLKTQELLPNGTLANYARGVMIDTYKGYNTVSHSGYGFGGQTQLITIPEENLGVVIFTNLQSINPTPISYKILDELLAEKEIETVTETESVITHNLNLFVGDYKEINSDMKMYISIENDTLKAKGSIGKHKIPLVAFSNNNFFRANSQSVKYDFTVTKDQDLVISFGGTPFYFKRAKLIEKDALNINNFIGSFYSKELDVTYTFSENNGKLILNYKNNKDIPLSVVQLNAFGNNNRTLYQFNNTKTKMFLSCDGVVSNIEFVKMK